MEAIISTIKRQKMKQEEINMRKKAIAIFEGYEVIDDFTFKKNGVEIDRGRFSYDSSFDILIPVGQKIVRKHGTSSFGVEDLNLQRDLDVWFYVISQWCIYWCKSHNKPL